MRDYIQQEVDERYAEAVNIVREANRASTGLLQRKLKVGYVVSMLLIKALEENGVIGAKDGRLPRKVL